MPDEAKLREELEEIDLRRQDLDRRIQETVDRQRYVQDSEEVERARTEERACLAEMDRLMTRIRAIEAKLQLLRRESNGHPQETH